jgi:putative selenium metabolism protein SsnA
MLIHNATLVSWDQTDDFPADHALLVREGMITEAGSSAELLARYPDEERLDAHGQLVMPGNICAHTHFYSAFARGLAIPGRAPRDFPEILRKLWWPLDKSLGEDDVRASTLIYMVDAIRHGTTTVFDHHASPNFIPGSLDVIASAVEQAGLRAVLCYEVTDRDGLEKAEAGIAENTRFIQRCSRRDVAAGRVAATFGLHAGLTLSDGTLAACRSAVTDDGGFHIHVAEHEADEYDSQAKSGLRVVDRLAKHGILGEKTIVAHAIHVDAREISLLAESGTWVTHQPRSNMNNGVGVAAVESMLRAGVRVGLGNDGFSNAMWEEWKAAYLVHKVWNRDPRRMQGGTIKDIAVTNNAALAQVFFPGSVFGSLRPGSMADLILVDYHPTTPMTPGNLPWHVLFGFHESMVTGTIVAGRVLMRGRELLTLDEKEIASHARQLAPAVWERYRSFVPAD